MTFEQPFINNATILQNIQRISENLLHDWSGFAGSLNLSLEIYLKLNFGIPSFLVFDITYDIFIYFTHNNPCVDPG